MPCILNTFYNNFLFTVIMIIIIIIFMECCLGNWTSVNTNGIMANATY